MTDLVGHFSALEIVWCVVALIAIRIAGLNYAEARRDIAALGPIRNGRRRIAMGNRRRERVRLTVNVANLGMGIVAGFIPAAQNPPATSLIFGAVFIGTSALLALSSWQDRADRVYLLTFRAIETKRQAEDRAAGDDRRAGYLSAQERTADATERIADHQE